MDSISVIPITDKESKQSSFFLKLPFYFTFQSNKRESFMESNSFLNYFGVDFIFSLI
jgi:hypothetical protein